MRTTTRRTLGTITTPSGNRIAVLRDDRDHLWTVQDLDGDELELSVPPADERAVYDLLRAERSAQTGGRHV